MARVKSKVHRLAVFRTPEGLFHWETKSRNGQRIGASEQAFSRYRTVKRNADITGTARGAFRLPKAWDPGAKRWDQVQGKAGKFSY